MKFGTVVDHLNLYSVLKFHLCSSYSFRDIPFERSPPNRKLTVNIHGAKKLFPQLALPFSLYIVCISNKFRAIAIGSIVHKLFNVVILSKEQNAFATSHLPFVFKPNMSFSHWMHVMLETLSYYNANGSNVYAVMLDASKALYFKKNKVSPLVLRLLLHVY